MRDRLFLGIDTSNYTTSLAIVNEKGDCIANLKRPLTVKSGERGVRQSDAVFMHTVNLPTLFEEAAHYLNSASLTAVAVSERPRNQQGSYMPCFLSGVSAAHAASFSANVPLIKTSHQCGHIMAAVMSSGAGHMLTRSFAAFHVSGGTTELVRVSPSESGFDADVVGGTLDLNAGQLIDRIGVLMGLDFPCGRSLELLALENKKRVPKKKISRSNTYVNLSGLENLAMNMLSETDDKNLVSAFVLNCVADALIDMSLAYISEYGATDFLFAGGVMSNSIIKNRILSAGISAYFAEPELSKDNAVGVAYIARRSFLSLGG